MNDIRADIGKLADDVHAMDMANGRTQECHASSSTSSDAGNASKNKAPVSSHPPKHPKSILNEYCQRRKLNPPTYIHTPNGATGHGCVVKIVSSKYTLTGRGHDCTQKSAEAQAAHHLCDALGLL